MTKKKKRIEQIDVDYTILDNQIFASLNLIKMNTSNPDITFPYWVKNKDESK
ncbi:hypothetical protein [Mycoplasmopsis pullorum]|uniref:hypothetical protein n=1 Tax=Mycoplasmopsis pullorum TaxID=48003 RepID=UPI0012EE002B|nr:hypothetical protein [Mycoplasmopsis pullorum]